MNRLFLSLVAGCATLIAAEKIVGGPFVVTTAPRTATVVWLVQADEATLRPPGDAPARMSPSLRVEKTSYAGLQANTRYDYEVAGQKGSFKTAPAQAQAEPYRFVVYGDTRTRHDVHRRVIETVIQNGIPDFVLHSGDLVSNGDDTALWPVFFDIERELLRKTIFFPALGNHEQNTPNFTQFLQVPAYYSFDWGNAHITCVFSDIGSFAPNAKARARIWEEQTRWLEEDLAAHQGADYRFVFAHHPPFTAVTRRQGDNAHMTALVPMFENYHVSAAFFGHDHNYQHFLKNGIHYVTTGGGGAPLYDVDKPPEGITQKVASIENFVSVSVNGKTAHFEAIAIGGNKLEEFDLSADPRK